MRVRWNWLRASSRGMGRPVIARAACSVSVRAASKTVLRFPSGRYCKAGSHDPKSVRVTTMIDEKLARRRAHENNIARYRRLLQTRLSDVERHFIESRLAEEQTALSMLALAQS